MAGSSQYTCPGMGESCGCSSRLHEVLEKHIGYDSFLPGQLEAAVAVLHGRDVFVRMATGSGKSLCMFLAPLAKGDKAVGVIISPLNGLMEEQVKYNNFFCYNQTYAH